MSQSLKHSVSVSVRVKPGGSAVEPLNGGCGIISKPSRTSFWYPSTVIEGSDQKFAVDALTGELVRKFCEGGFACTLMAYGQTGSGKTHTMFGPPGSLTETSLQDAAGGTPEDWGVFPRVMLQLLQAPELSGAIFHASAIEVYMDHTYDLLNGRNSVKVGSVKAAGRGRLNAAEIGKAPVYSGHAIIAGGLHPGGCTCFKCFNAETKEKERAQRKKVGLDDGAPRPKKQGVPRLSAAPKPVRRDGSGPSGGKDGDGGDSGSSFGTEGDKLWPLSTPADVAKLARLVEAERTSHGHALNDHSSRSHCLIRVTCTHVIGGRSLKRLFLFVDLAGSERIKKSEVTGSRQKEASNINNSLTTLGRVVKELTSSQAHVSYRDSALTMLLRASFSGASCTHVVVNVSSEEQHAEETVCSLRFGEKLSSVKTSAVAAPAVDIGAQRSRVNMELAASRKRLAEFEQAGQCEHLNPSAPPSERRSLETNMRTLEVRKQEVRGLKAGLVEMKASTIAQPAEVISLKEKLEGALFSLNNINDIVERQKTIPGLWLPASSGALRVRAQVAALEAQMDTLGV